MSQNPTQTFSTHACGAMSAYTVDSGLLSTGAYRSNSEDMGAKKRAGAY